LFFPFWGGVFLIFFLFQLSPPAAPPPPPGGAPPPPPPATPHAQTLAAAPAPPTPDHTALLAEIEQQYQAKVREAHAAGFREGEASGRARGAAEVQPAIEKLVRAAADLAQMRPRLRKEAEGDTVKLALAIARRILRRELAVDPEALHGVLMAALERLQGQEISRVRVHPSQAAQVKALLANATAGRPVEIVADASRSVGDAIFETDRGNLDASVETQLQEIERGLIDRLQKQP
jgi:flagellar assembly protein FliH